MDTLRKRRELVSKRDSGEAAPRDALVEVANRFHPDDIKRRAEYVNGTMTKLDPKHLTTEQMKTITRIIHTTAPGSIFYKDQPESALTAF